MTDPLQSPYTPTIDPMAYPTYASLFENQRKVAQEVRKYEPSSLIASIAGLLTMPEFQANAVRLEVLQHLAAAKAHGKLKPQPKNISSWLNNLGDGWAGRMEDPVEDVFVSRVSNKERDFLVFEGLYENSGFYLQLFLNLLDKMPDQEPFIHLRRSAHALLLLSDEAVRRAGIPPFTVGNIDPIQTVDSNLAQRGEKAKKRAIFSKADLDRFGIERQDIKAFILDKSARKKLGSERYGHSSLERYPLLSVKGDLILILPAAVSMAIRRMIIEFCLSNGYKDVLHHAYANEFEEIFENAPILNGNLMSRPKFHREGNVFVAEMTAWVDHGRLLHIFFVLDNFSHYDQTGVIGLSHDMIHIGNKIKREIDKTHRFRSSKHGFQSGLSLIVQCFWGRPVVAEFESIKDKRWKDEIISAPDLITMSRTSDISPLYLWSLLDSKDLLEEIGVDLDSFNINGLLNIYAWSESLGGHLIPHGDLPDDAADKSLIFQINQNSLLNIRQRVAHASDIHRTRTWDNRIVKVRRHNEHSFFKEDENTPLYVSLEDLDQGRFVAVYETKIRGWWITTDMPHSNNREFHYRLCCTLTTWLERSAKPIEDTIHSLKDGPIAWICRFEDAEDPRMMPVLSRDQAKALLDIRIDGNAVLVTARAGFLASFCLDDNMGESLLVEAFLSGTCRLSEDVQSSDIINSLMKQIVPNKWARYLHIFLPQGIRDFLAHKASNDSIKTTKTDNALSRIGLGWRVRTREEGAHIEGIELCRDYLNCLIDSIWGRIRLELMQYNRKRTLIALLHNYESLEIETKRWLRTARAVLSMHNDKESIKKESSIELSRFNAALLGSQILLEMALCECPKDSSIIPGQLDISRLFADIMLMYQLGGWSDAIRYECKAPEIRITPFGNLQTDTYFDEIIANPYGQNLSILRYQDGANTYEVNFRDLESTDTVRNKWEIEFWEAWTKEFGFTIDDMRFFMDNLESEGIKRQELVFSISEFELYALDGSKKLDESMVRDIIKTFSLSSRPKWECPPDGFSRRDLYPWRFRRRLSLVSKPIIMIDDSPVRYLVAPGLVRAGIKKVIEYCHTGGYDAENFLQKPMRSWIGSAENKRGHAFNHEVAEQLKTLGWEVRSEIKLTRVLNQEIDRNYGDIDVLAWKKGRVLIIECKSLELAMTISDIAHQLFEFRGEIDTDGKPDRMKKHLLRIEKLKKHSSNVAKFIKVKGVLSIEGLLVFSRAVPMQFSGIEEKYGLRILTKEQISNL